ncbi:coiled-coil domain-containing protein 187 isoform X2 [Trichomycterus rosablanca]|uniref:coiled-coil domain-containing protein 187 isoform X2 n=1 Tax=Trichomycterus rosablanca TaxID=2290929 RepID=UPI002F35F4FC
MAELEVDSSNLAPVQEVSQYFSLLEDGALAYNLQEQEIESFYSNNVQRNQLVQKDIRVAKRLQNEEKERAHTLRQATHQLEEQDSEYARRIQGEIQQAAEAAWRTEEEDKEIAKRIQEEEELRLRQINSGRRTDDRGIVRDRTCLDLGELEQVLRDEELAHRLQELEEKIHRQNSSLATPSQTQYPAGDFRVAQVAQDEEIARFIQKEELEAQMRSGQLEHCGPVRGYREMSHVYDHNGVYDRQMQRERLDSEGFVSPGYESSPERQPSSHTTIAVQPQQHTRNVVEDLDPTFPRNDSGPAEQDTGGTLQMQSTSQTASNLEPAFVTPTKRHLPKSLRIKSKEKKESTKRKGSCKQQ